MAKLRYPLQDYDVVTVVRDRRRNWYVRAHVDRLEHPQWGSNLEVVDGFAHRDEALAAAIPLRRQIRASRRMLGRSVEFLEVDPE